MPRAPRFGLEIEINQEYATGRVARRLEEALAPFANRHAIHHENDYDDLLDEDYDIADVWYVKYDGSCGNEITTPAIRWSHWPHVAAVMRGLYAMGARTGSRCGLHVHHEAPIGSIGIQRLWRLWYTHETAIMGMLAPSRMHNEYCQTLSYWLEAFDWRGSRANPDTIGTLPDRQFQNMVQQRNRYFTLNLTQWWHNGRIEVRAHHGTLNPRDAKFWVLFTQRLIKVAGELSRPIPDRPARTIRDQIESLSNILTTPADARRVNWQRRMEAYVQRRQPRLLSA